MVNTSCTLIYDSECTLCSRFKQALSLIDIKKQIQFLSLHDPKTFSQFPELSVEDCIEDIHLVTFDGRIYTGGEVVTYLTTILPGVKKFSWLIENESGQKASKAFYKRINKMRMMKKRNCYTCGS